jgi:hypothetical protein
MDRPGISQVQTVAPSGADARWLGSIGSVTSLKYSWTLPGGASAMSCLLQTEPNLRTVALNPGRLVRVYRGGSVIWSGKLAEPQPSPQGWQITAAGLGTLGANFMAHYTSWTADGPVNLAISRGLPWNNPGIGGTPGLWLSQKEDDASTTITDFLNAITGNGALTWYVDGTATLRVIPIPTAPTRLLIAADPAARTITADINTLWVRYQATADSTSGTTSTPATYGTVQAVNQASVNAHGAMEAYADLSSAGVMSSAAALAAGQAALAKYVRASYAGPFTIRQGQILTLGGSPVDIGAERGVPGVCQLLLVDGPYGGEVAPGPVTFPIGQYEYDDTAQTAQVTPFQSISSSLSSLLAAMFPAKSTDTAA